MNQFSVGYESVKSPMGSKNSPTHHSNDIDSSHDPQEEKLESGKHHQTEGSYHVQNSLDLSVHVQGSVCNIFPENVYTVSFNLGKDSVQKINAYFCHNLLFCEYFGFV